MTGAAAKRAKRDRNQTAPRNPSLDTPSEIARDVPSAYDGPSDPQRGRGPGSAGGPSTPGRGRTPSINPPPAGAPSVRSSSRPPSTTRPNLIDPARSAPTINRNVDWAGNAYNLYSQVSSDFTMLPEFYFSYKSKCLFQSCFLGNTFATSFCF